MLTTYWKQNRKLYLYVHQHYYKKVKNVYIYFCLFRRGTILLNDSSKNDWIFVVKSVRYILAEVIQPLI